MSSQQIVDVVRSFEGALVLTPDEASGAPEIAWGDYFFYNAPDGQVPAGVQPFATIITASGPLPPSSNRSVPRTTGQPAADRHKAGPGGSFYIPPGPGLGGRIRID